ncbi:sugar ABC transporter permease [Oceanicola granulosus HTCC2516]|uniref:Sugar ABC transporter permease n=1 Tax=Oceanicola granulosus (strain ATCC BAA-861 / DSM 15982 / KCTC 12143 / HTCC2516) TaxID=314256 RepID=Q2CEE5_OCEGH|nr:sugar ABC transporter permease [Oceanicola granulosus]EAR51052.1 sugar ABC transporter permease [Oceanicola granulosus HTCC2516]
MSEVEGKRLATGRINLLFALPALTLFGLFVLLPIGSSVWFAFTKWNGFTTPEAVGFDNFRRAFRDTVHLWSYVNVTLYILGTLVLEVMFGLVIAVLLNSDRFGFGLMRGMFFSPMILSMTAAGVLWTFVLDYRLGLLNAVLESVGREEWTRPWLSESATALIAIMVVSGWRFAGFYMIIFFAALRRIPRNIYEAATLDGAGPVRQFFTITLPLLRASMMTCILLAVTGGFAGFDLFFTLTNGGPFNATEVPATWIIRQGFDNNQLGYATALTVILAVVVLAVALLFLRISERVNVVRY